MSWGFVAVGVGTAVAGAVGQSEASKRAAKSAGDAANAQAAEAANQRNIITQQAQTNQQSAMSLAGASPQELQALDHSYSVASSNLDRESRLLAAIDPSMMEASKQALSLLKGENSGYGGALADQRKTQRQQLINQLKAAYGPDAETSSVGQKALQSFDQQSNVMIQQANQGALSNAFGIASSDVGARSRAATGQLQQIGQGYGAIQDRKLNTQLNTGNAMLNALSGTSSSMIQAAGAPYVQGTLEAQGNAALGGQVMGIGGSMIGAGMYGAMSKKPTGNPDTGLRNGMSPGDAAMQQAPTQYGPPVDYGWRPDAAPGMANGMGNGGGSGNGAFPWPRAMGRGG